MRSKRREIPVHTKTLYPWATVWNSIMLLNDPRHVKYSNLPSIYKQYKFNVNADYTFQLFSLCIVYVNECSLLCKMLAACFNIFRKEIELFKIITFKSYL